MSETVLYNFAGDASNPGILVQNGTTLYGNAQNGGTYSKGKIYSISINGSSYTTLYNFGTNANDGVTPTWLVINSTGTTLYGTTLTGGVNNNGTLFSLSTTSPYTYNKLYDFSNNGVSGSVPFRLKISGNVLYGTSITNYPALNYGTIYSYNISTLTFAQVYISPTPSIIFQTLDISGTTLYYTTNRFGGPPFNSIIYSIPTTGGSPATVYNIGSKNPSNLIVSGGIIYGSNQTDQLSIYSGWGIFSVSTSGTGFQQLVTGSYIGPYMTNLILSGTTLYASISNSSPDNGSIYSISTSGTNGTTLYSFAGPTTDGSNPLVAVSSGVTLYGTTFTGGSLNNGTVFSFYNGKIYNFVPITSDYYNIFTNGQMSVGNNTPGARYTNLAITMDVAGNINAQGSFNSYSSSCFQLPADSSANRPTLSGSTYKGMIRYNTDVNLIEFYNGVSWNYLIPGTPTLTITPSGGSPTNYTYQFGTANTLNTSGYYTVLPGANMRLKIQMWGAGGGGGIGGANPCYGGAGGYVEGIINLVSGTTYVFLIGQGGARATAYTPNTGTIGSAAFPDGGQSGNNTGSGLPNPASSAGPYPNDGTNAGYGPASGGGSTRFGLYNQGSVTITNSASNYNNSLANYYLISGGGGGGADYTANSGTNPTGVITPGGWGAGGGPSGGAGTAGAGVAWYGTGSTPGTPNCEASTSPGGGGSTTGGSAGTNGRLGPGTAGAKYQGGNSTGGGGGGGYYGGGGAAGYYAVGGGGSGYIDTSVITSYLSQTATTGVTTNYVSPTGSTTKPTSPFTGNPSGNGGTPYGTAAPGDSFTSSIYNYINGSDGAIIFTFQ